MSNGRWWVGIEDVESLKVCVGVVAKRSLQRGKSVQLGDDLTSSRLQGFDADMGVFVKIKVEEQRV